MNEDVAMISSCLVISTSQKTKIDPATTPVDQERTREGKCFKPIQ